MTLANSNEAPLAVGGYTGSAWISKAEIFNITTNTWTELVEYPYHTKYVSNDKKLIFQPKTYSSIAYYATVTTSQGALIIGGYCDSCSPNYVATVASYKEDGWKKLDDLQSTRNGHRAIINGDKVFVIGGIETKYGGYPIINRKLSERDLSCALLCMKTQL